MRFVAVVFFGTFYYAVVLPVSSAVIINEVADKGSSDVAICNNTGSDWIELYLAPNASAVNLTGFILHDDNGPNDTEAYVFPAESIMTPGEYLVLCLGNEDDASSPQFGIGGTDQVTLLDTVGAVVSTTGALQGRGEVDVSFAYDGDTYVYTSTATPGLENVLTLLPEPETVEEMRARLIAQNELGTRFFNMDEAGLEVQEGLGALVDLHMTVDPAAWQQTHDERSYEIYRPFESVHVTALDDPDTVHANLTSPGRFRPKGQSTLSFGTCLNRTVPYSVDFDYTDSSQTLFGVRRGYLRTHFGDGSFLREWAVHRMLARFGLPHLRTRTVRFHVNGVYVGLYSFMEAPDQDYVFQRSFPDYDPEQYGLYKVKTTSLGCGQYDPGALERAEALINSTAKPPYSFERGDHRSKSLVAGNTAWEQCIINFSEEIAEAFADVMLAYLRADKDCAKMLVAEGIIDRDLGGKALESNMETFVANNLADNECDAGCANSNLAEEVDTTQFLRNFAAMAALLHQDSPLGNGNNYYLASTGSGDGWKIVLYDLNSVLSTTSDDTCQRDKCIDELIHWSIERPTCRSFESNQIAGPLLANETLRKEYLGYVKEFNEEIMGNSDVHGQIANHLVALKGHISGDPWSDDADVYGWELAEEDTWLRDLIGFKYVPFLPALRARSAEIAKQLEALDSGTFPRHLDDIQAGETCVNWDSTDARDSFCARGCAYEGCVRDDFDLSGFCNEDNGICYQGVIDLECDGVIPGLTYEGMEPLNDEKDSFCWDDPTLGNIRLSECPDFEGGGSNPTDVQGDACPGACAYDECARDGFEISGYCDEAEGICYQGVIDIECDGVDPGLQYEGMEPLNDEKDSFCWNDPTLGSVRLSECPDFQGGVSSTAAGLRSITNSYAIASFTIVALSLLL